MISWDDFEKVELRIGTVIEVEDFPEARKPAHKLKVDFGSEVGVRKSNAQLTELYDKETLNGKQVLAVTNFPSKQIGPFVSECLVTGVQTEEGAVALITSDLPVANGKKLF